MLSVLIPIYNWKVVKLVIDLHAQCSSNKFEFEIICIDDNSDSLEQENKSVEKLSNVTYTELPQNVGRSKIRNLLAEKAKFENLLFLDCDIDIDNNFIANYITFFNTNKVVCGGLRYQITKPEPQKLLRWKYGKKHEAKEASVRCKKPYNSFKSCNFLIAKTLFQNIRFSEVFTSYGHEDTLFGIQLEQNKIQIEHINNPITHLGLDNAEDYIEKTKQAIQNLVRHKMYYQNIKLLKFANNLRRIKVDKIYLKKFNNNKPKILTNLLSDKPKLINLARFKIGYLLELQNLLN